MKALKETDFDFLNSPENPYLLGVKLPERGGKLENEGSIIIGRVVEFFKGKFSKLSDLISHEHQGDHVPHSH